MGHRDDVLLDDKSEAGNLELDSERMKEYEINQGI